MKESSSVTKNFFYEQNSSEPSLNMQEFKRDLLERTNQMISLCQNADLSANRTVVTLADQQEQLMDIDAHLSSVDATLIDTKRDINRLKGIVYRVIGTFRSKFHSRIRSKLLAHSRKTQNSSTPPQRRQVSRKSIEPEIPASNSVIDGEIDQAFYQIDYIMRNLKDKAYTINDQLVAQADLLDHIQGRVLETTDHIEQQNYDVKKMN